MKILSTLFLSAFFCFTGPVSINAHSQLFPTNLRITVLNNLGNLEPDATVIVFENEEDYRNEQNPVAGPELTDRKGRVTFKRLPAKEYFVHVVKEGKTNIGEGVKVEKLQEGRMNKINVVIR